METANNTCLFAELGMIDYATGVSIQKKLAKARSEKCIPDILLSLEHNHTYTLGTRGVYSDILASNTFLNELGVSIFKSERGGQVTYHGPGQTVIYPIIDVRPIGGPVKYVRLLEELVILTLKDFGLHGERKPRLTGIWVGDAKIAAIRLKISRGIATHGFALNVNTDLSYFDHIIPCGDSQLRHTSMTEVTGTDIHKSDVSSNIIKNFSYMSGRSMKKAHQQLFNMTHA